MLKQRLLAMFLTLCLAFGLATPVAAQTYSFELVSEEVNVFLNADGTMSVDYVFTFKNNPGASPIDFVDVGLPNGNYKFGTIMAWANRKSVRVTKDYQGDGPYGVAIELGANAIRPGETGEVRIYVGRIDRMLFPDTSDKTYTSTEFSPTWFGSKFVTGSSSIHVTFHLPPGITNDEPRYHPARGDWPCDRAPIAGRDENKRVTYEWICRQASGSKQYFFGASFPAKYVPAGSITQPSIFDEFQIKIDYDAIFTLLFFACFGSFFLGLPLLAAISERRRRLQYMKPQISIEGHGIKRGLTAVEAAVLLGLPLDKVMTMILFGLVKKGAVEVVSREPLELRDLNPNPAQPLRSYEVDFAAAFRLKKTAERRRALQSMAVSLVKSVTEKMKGFSGKETIEYYQSINERAWKHIDAAGTPEVQAKTFDEAVEWTMLDKDYEDRSKRTFTRPIYVPGWWRHYDPVYRSHSHLSGGSINLGGSPGSLPGADFAASVVNGTENFARSVLGGTDSFTQGVTEITNPPPPPSRSGGGYRGGGGCACACACAGCACACAGGGR